MIKDSVEKFSISFNDLVDLFSPFYKNSYSEKSSVIPSFDLLESYQDPIFILDFTTMGYTYVNNSVRSLDIDFQRVLTEGVAYSIDLILEHEREVLLQEVFPILFKYAKLYMDNKKFPDFKSSYCSHVRLKTGEYQWFTHEISIFGPDPASGNIIGLKQLKNIHHIKKDDDLDLFIFEKDVYGIYRQIVKKSFDLRVSEQPKFATSSTGNFFGFSKREVEVIEYIKRGLSTKEIADALVISDHTVNNHRKNILKKANGLSFIEIIQMVSTEKNSQ